MFRTIATLLALLLPVSAYAQGVGQLGPGQVVGNPTAARAPGKASDPTAIIDRAFGSTRGSILTRGASNWQLLPPGANGTFLKSQGAGADLVYGAGSGSTTPGGSNGQLQYNSSGSFAGVTGGDITVNTGSGVASVNQIRGVPVDPSGSVTNDLLTYNGTSYVHSALSTLVNTICSAAPLTCTSLFGYAYAGWWGVKCDNTANDGPAINTALAAINYARLVLPSGTCKISSQIAYNSWTTNGGLLTVPGIQLVGQGRDATKLSTFIPGDYMIAVNQAWASLHQSIFTAVYEAGSGSLAAGGPYYLRISVTTPTGDEIDVSRISKVFSIPASSGAIRVQLQPIQAGYCYKVYLDLADPPAHYGVVSGLSGTCLGGNQSILVTAIGTANTYPNAKFAVWQQPSLENMSLVNPNNTAVSSAILWFRTGYAYMRNVYINNFKANGLVQPSWSGDNDGWFVTTIDQSKFDQIGGWCYNGAGYTLENSNLTIRDSIFNLCGTLETNLSVPITVHDVVNGSPSVFSTNVANGLQVGDDVLMQNMVGSSLTTFRYRVCVILSSVAFELCTIDGITGITTTGTYSLDSGTVTLMFRPPQMAPNGSGPTGKGGAVAYNGLISNIINNGFTVNNNVDLYFAETGSSDNATITGNDFENTWGQAVYVASGLNFRFQNNECLSNTTKALGFTVGCIQFGSGQGFGNVINQTIDGMKIRNDLGSAFAFTQYPGGAGGGNITYAHTVQARNIYWQTYVGFAKYYGFQGDNTPFFWVRFDGKTGGTCTVKSSYGLDINTPCVRTSTGTYTITFRTESQRSDTNYAVTGYGLNFGVSAGIPVIATYNVNNLVVQCLNLSAAVQDCDTVSLVGYSNPGQGYQP